MKLNSLFMLAFGLLFFSCSDDLSNIGSSIRPGGDDLTFKSTTFNLTSSTFLADSIYIRTPNPLLGEVTDKFYGTIRADYAAQFYCEPGFNFDVVNSSDSVLFSLSNEQDSLVNNKLDSAVLRIFYGSYIGDSLTPMAVTAYQIQQQLPKNFYSNIDFTPYITPLLSIGSAAYTGKDISISDSIKEESNYTPYVDIKLDDSVPAEFLDAVINDPAVFTDQKTFQEFFPGVYFKNTFGDGTILQVNYTRIQFYYRTYHDRKPGGDKLVGHDGKDSSYIANRTKYIAVTPDVIQLNSIENPLGGGSHNLLENDSATFVTSPAGYFTELKIPVGKIMTELRSHMDTTSSQYLNGLTLTAQAYAPIENIFSSTPPSYMLMVQRDKMNEFFEDNKLPDSSTSYMAAYVNDSTNGSYTYSFGNLNKLVLTMYDEVKKEDGSIDPNYEVAMAIVPIKTQTDTYGTSIIQVSNYFMPGAVSLKGGKNPQQASMVYTLQRIE